MPAAVMRILFVIAVIAASPAGAQPQVPQADAQRPTPEAAAPGDRRGPDDPAELEAFLDGLFAAQMDAHDIAGAVVSVVRDGRVLLSKGYGWADVDRRIPVDPETTLFRIGSITKLFTWTAVLQLRDEGRLDLDTDVNTYLDFRIPDTYPEPITLRHLLTHTPGFEDRIFGLFGPASGLPRGEWLRQQLPARVRPPGVLPAYSNHGTALAGYIVERVSGMSWEEYVETRILEPLGMTSATPRQPVPDALQPQMAAGYRFEEGRFAAKPFEHIEGAPAGSISASAVAMAAFMIAHLQDGAFGGTRILAEDTAREMHAQAFAPAPRINGLALGFYEKSSHGLRIIGHSGGTQWFFSDLALVPSERLGIFVSYNSAGAAPLPFVGYLPPILDRYYPDPRGPEPLAPGWDERARAYTGGYRLLRRPYTTFEKLLGLVMEIRVDAVAPGELRVGTPFGVERVREVEPGYLRAVDGDLEVAFAGDGRGGYEHLFLSIMPPTPAERVGFWQSRALHGAVFAFAMALFVSVLVLMPARYALQRSTRAIPPLRGTERGLRWAALAFAALAFGFLIMVGSAVDEDAVLSGAAKGALRAALLLPLVSIPVAAVIVAGLVPAFRRRYWGRWGRLHYAAFAAAAVLFLVQLHAWNLLGWRM